MHSVLILVVEDEPLILEDLRYALEEGGFEVAEASSGEQAIAMLDAGGAYRVLVTDVNLAPRKLTGWDVARRAREISPEFPVIYTTANGADEWGAKGVPNSVLIQKPYATAQIMTAISQLLNTGGPTPIAGT